MKLTLKGIDAVVRKLRKKYKEQGKSEEWLVGWERGFRKSYSATEKEKRHD
jgi:hypothetical protein